MTIKAPQAKTVLSEGFHSALPGALACIVNLRHELTHAPFIVCRPGPLQRPTQDYPVLTGELEV